MSLVRARSVAALVKCMTVPGLPSPQHSILENLLATKQMPVGRRMGLRWLHGGWAPIHGVVYGSA